MRTGRRDLLPIVAALATLYLVWGSTYLAIRIAINDIPPLLMSGFRYFLAGAILYLIARWRGARRPTPREWAASAVIGVLLLGVGNGGVSLAEQEVSTGLAALVISTVPLWGVLFGALFGCRPTLRELLGVLLGLTGIVLLEYEGDLMASPKGTMMLLIAAIAWSFGSTWGNRLPLPAGLMNPAAQMFAGGAFTIVAGLVAGDRLTAFPSLPSLGAFAYLVVFGSLIGFTCYLYLLERIRPAQAMSYGYVNPVVAILLGVILMGEKVGRSEGLAMAIILTAVVLVMSSRES